MPALQCAPPSCNTPAHLAKQRWRSWGIAKVPDGPGQVKSMRQSFFLETMTSFQKKKIAMWLDGVLQESRWQELEGREVSCKKMGSILQEGRKCGKCVAKRRGTSLSCIGQEGREACCNTTTGRILQSGRKGGKHVARRRHGVFCKRPIVGLQLEEGEDRWPCCKRQGTCNTRDGQYCIQYREKAPSGPTDTHDLQFTR